MPSQAASIAQRRHRGVHARFDWVADNALLIADSNHGYKTIGVGKLVAQHLTTGLPVEALAPFPYTRFALERTFGDRNSN